MNTLASTMRGSRSLALAGILMVGAACSATGERSSGVTTPTGPATTSPTAEAPTTRRVVNHVLGDPSATFPDYSVDLLDGWSSISGFVIKRVAGVMGVSVWDVSEVPSDPCHWAETLAEPAGPTVDHLVQLLVAQKTRNASTPIDVTLGGYSGKYLEWSVPQDAVVTGDADFEGCDIQPSNGHRDFISWLSSTGTGSRYQQVAGQVDRLWILDVDGQRLVVDATYSPDTSEVARAELARVVESLRFEAP